MAIIVGGHETGLLDTSLNQLKRDDRTSESEIGQGEQLHVNVSNGNLVLTQQDTFMPSRGADFQLLRTYNSRGVPSDAGQRDDDRWSLTTAVTLNEVNSGGEKHFLLTYGDGSVLEFRLDAESGLYVSTDGQGAYETLQDLDAKGNDEVYFVVTRADQSQLSFNKFGDLLLWKDTNGVATEYRYSQNRLVQVRDDEGHVINYKYAQGNLVSINDEAEGVLVQYRYAKGQLTEVQDRFGHVTKYFYSSDGFLIRIQLPNKQTVNGKVETYDNREINFEYESVNWSNGDSGTAKVLTRMVDAEGNITTFDYDFNLRNDAPSTSTSEDGDKFYDGGTTRVVDALGNARAYSNDAIHRQWRLDNGYYATYSANNASIALQADEIRSAHSLTYEYDGRGYITAVIDQQQFKTTYSYDDKGNLLSVTDRNGWGVLNSTSDYYKDLRESLGFPRPVPVDAGDRAALKAAFTSTFTYDDRGNVLTSTDNSGNTTVYTYTSFNKLESITSPNGGVTTLEYDANQNLTKQVDPSGDITEWEYDVYGNQVKRIVYLDKNDLLESTKQQVTQYYYDLFGNNVETLDAEGYTVHNHFDHFGNLTQTIDANGGVTSYTYDKDNRLLSITDAEGHTTFSTYDAVGNRISFQDANGKTVTYIYDRNNRLISTIDPSADSAALTRETNRQYDVVGNQVGVTDAEGRETTYNYNARRELVEVVTTTVKGADGSTDVQYTTSYAYDGEGNGIRVTDNRGNTTQFLYQEDGLLRSETNPIGHVTQYHYDANRNLLSVIAGAQLAPNKQQKLTFAYDSEDQVLTATDAEGNETAYTYDAPGTIASVTDGNGNVTEYKFDLNNRLIREIRPQTLDHSGVPQPGYELIHQLDGNGNEVETIDENGNSTLFEFDRDNNITKTTDANGIVTTYAYDPNHNLTRIAIGDSNGEAQVSSYVYDEFDQLIAEVDGVGNALAESDDPLYQALRVQLGYAENVGGPNGLTNAEKTELRNLYTERYAYDRVGNLLSTQDHLGRVTAFDYDNLNRLVLQTDAFGETQIYRYDGNGNRVAEFDELGRERSYSFDAMDRLTAEVDPLLSRAEYVYDDFGNLIERTEAAGESFKRTGSYVYDLNNLLVAEKDPGGHTTSYEYDAVGNRLKVTDGRGNSTDYVYDAMNRNIKIIDPLNFETKFEYDGVGNQVKIIDARNGESSLTYDPGNRLMMSQDPEGRITKFEYDALNNVVTLTTGVGGTGAGSLGEEVTRFEYDAEDNLRAVVDAEQNRFTKDFDRVYNEILATDARGNETKSEYDALNRLIKVTDAKGGVTSFGYDVVGNTLTETDALDRVTTYQYADDDQLLTVIDADGVETQYVNNVFGVLSVTRAANIAGQERTRSFEYNDDGLLVKETNPLFGTKVYEYDENHNVTRVEDENGHSTHYAYDANNRVETITDELGGVTRYEYDGNGNRTAVIDAENRKTSYYYNANDELALTVDALGFGTSRTYDVNGNLATSTQHKTAIANPAALPAAHPEDRTTRYAYDALNQLVALTDPMGEESQFTYDAVGNQVEEIDQKGRVTTSEYDELNRLVKVIDALGGERSYSYDKVGNQLTETDENGNTTSYTYDLLDRLLTVTDPLGGERSYTYDKVGNQLTQTDENLNTTTFTYDKLDRQVSRENAAGDFASMTYDAVGNQLSFTDENGDTSSAKFDALNRVEMTTDTLGEDYAYAYDKVGNELSRTDQLNNTTTFTYDALNRVLTREDPEGGVRTLAYDFAGNNISETDETDNTTTYGYDLNDRLTLIRDALGGEYEFGYDAVGNQVSEIDQRDNKTVFEYDDLNRLITVTDAEGGVRAFTYDAVGNTLSEDANGNTTSTRYDENNRVVKSLSGEGYLTIYTYDPVGNELQRQEYNQTYALVGGAIPDPDGGDIPRITESTYDVLNRLVSVTDSTGLRTHYEYDKVGNPTRTYQSAAPVPVVTVGLQAAALSAGPVAAAAVVELGNGKEEIVYDKKGQVISRTDAAGVKTLYERDEKGNVITMTEAYGSDPDVSRVTTYTHDSLGRTLTETNAFGTTIAYTYDKADRILTRTTSGAGVADRVESFTYDAKGRLVLEVNGVNNRTEYVYDAADNLVTKIFAEGTADEFTNTFVYDGEDRLIAETDGEGVTTEYVYDENGNKEETIQAANIPAERRSTTYEYDADNRLIAITNPEGGTTRYDYDAEGNQFRITDANGTVTENTFDAEGRILTNIVGVGGKLGGIKTTNVYDQRGNVLSTTVGFADGSDARTSSYEYDVLDRIVKITDPEGYISTFKYDSFGNQTEVTIGLYEGADADKIANAQPQTTRFEYDTANQLILTVDGEGNAVSATYDKHGNRTSQTTGIATADSNDIAHESTATFKYDLDGKMVEKTTDSGVHIQIVRDSLGQQTRISTLQAGSSWAVQAYEYDSYGRATAQIDSYGVRTETVYDAVGNIESISRDGTRTTTYAYDLNGNLLSETGPEGAVTQYEYDEVGNEIRVIDAEGGSQRFYYNEFNQLIAATDARNFFTEFELDVVGNVTKTTQYATVLASVPGNGNLPTPVADSSADRVVEQTYDNNGKRLSQTSANGLLTSYEYDSVGRLLKQTEDVSGVDAVQLDKTWDTADRVLAWEWDLAGRLTSFVNVDGVVEDYKYDAASNLTEEKITDPNVLVTTGAVDQVRTTTYTYDLSNRLLSQTTGTNVQTLTYDNAGNVVSKTDALGNTTTTRYDLNNRVVSVKDAKNQEISYGYDRVGNLTSINDPRGYTISFTYDLADRVLTETTPTTTTYTILGGETTGTITTTNTYDQLGNLIERTDERGNKTTNWYDDAGNVIAEVNVDLRLQKYTYNAFGELVTLTTYKSRMADEAASRNPGIVPAGSGETAVVTNYYDNMGNIVRTVYPQIAVTTVTGTGAAATSSTTNQVPEERSYFDAWGNLVESVDRKGQSSYSYVDNRGRRIALVDTGGFMITTAYDSQGNIIRQSKYETAVIGAEAKTLPGAPSGKVNVVDRYYDTQGQLIREVSPEVMADGGLVRVTTEYAYDAAGNLSSRTLASGAAEEQTEYYYYDAANQRTAIVSANRVLNTFTFDGNGNLTNQKRYINPVAGGVNLASATAASLLSGIATNSTQDQETRYTYNEVNLLATQTDEMGSDDIVTSFKYDASGNLTLKTDAEGNQTKIAYDAGNRVEQTITATGGYSFIAYDVNGLKVKAWTGGDPDGFAPAVDEGTIAASVYAGPSGEVSINWSAPATSVTSWVAWDTVPRTNLVEGDLPSSGPGMGDVYANATGSTGTGTPRSTSIPLSELTPGTTVYFRVMVKDAANNMSWSEERSLVVPPAISALSVKQSGNDFIVEASFSAGVSNPTITSSAFADVGMTLVSGNQYSATLSGIGNPATASIDFEWTANGFDYTAPAGTILRAAEATENRVTGWIEWPLPSDGGTAVGSTQLLILNGVAQPESAMSRVLDTVQHQPTTEVSQNYDIYYGDRTSETHDIDISFEDTQQRIATFNSYVTNDDDEITDTIWNLTWKTDNDDLVSTKVSVDLEQAEIDRINGDGVKVGYRLAGTDGVFSTVANTTVDGTTREAVLSLAESSDYDLKIFYTDTDGNEVIVDWRRITTPAEAADESAGTTTTSGKDNKPSEPTRTEPVGAAINDDGGTSLIVLAAERGGQIGAGTIATRVVTEGTYSGPLDPSGVIVSLGLTDTGGAEGSKTANGFEDGTYFTRIVYNDLGMKIASNEDTGLWRTFGVDANGNTVQTRVWGTEEETGDSIVTYAYFDSRNNEISSIGPEVNGQAAVTSKTFDYDGRVLTVLKPGASIAQAYSYDGVGNLVSQGDSLGNDTTYAYDRLGNVVKMTDPEGHTQRMVYSYSGANTNRLTSTSFDGLTTANESYSYDAFGRRTAITNGAGQSTAVTYDQHDRVVTVTDALGHVTYFWYDELDNQTWVKDANGNYFGRAYNASSFITREYSFDFKDTPADFDIADARAAAANGHANLIEKQTQYDVFNNKISTTDAMGRSESFDYGAFGRLNSAYGINYSYDKFGRQVAETDSQGRDIERDYDDAGRVTLIDDQGTDTNTAYTYDVAGNRLTEVLTVDGTQRRSQAYTYDANGALLSWTESTFANTVTASYTYYDDGNIKQIATSDGTKDYEYDAADRVTKAGSETFTYSTAGNRETATVGGVTTTYTYDAAGRLDLAVAGGEIYDWTYDAVGNATYYSQVGETTTDSYDASNRVYSSVTYKSGDDGFNNTSTTYFDKSGRVTSTTLVDSTDSDEVKTYTYTYAYDANGLQTSVTGSGTDDVGGSSTSTYDVNGRLVSVNLGQGDDEDQERDQINTFAYDNDGKIIYATRDEGMEDESAVTTYYLYANGYSVGELTSSADPTINQNDYATVKTINTGYEDDYSAFPGTSVSRHTVVAGNTLKSLAAQYYGSPDLWFVIAEANGLTGSENLKAGSSLLIPATVENAYHTADTHTLYKEGDIVGSKLPNLASPPPSDGDKCAIVAAIILIIVVAIVAVVLTVVTVGAAAPAAAAALGLTAGSVGAIIVGVAVGAVVGAAIAFAASVATQLILVGFGLQEEFDWKAVAADTLVGAFGGAAAGLGAAVTAAKAATTAVKVLNVVGQVALESAGETASQAIQNDGEIANPWLIVAAGAGGGFGAIADVASAAQKAGKAASKVDDVADVAAKAGKAAGKLDDVADGADAAAKATKSLDDLAEQARQSGKKFDTDVFAQAFKQKFSKKGIKADLVEANESLIEKLGKAKTAIKEFRESGTVFKGELTKTVRYFDTVDGVRVAKYKQVIRTSKSVVGAGNNSKLVRSINQTTGLIEVAEVANKTKLAKLKDAVTPVLKKVSDGAKEYYTKAVTAVSEFKNKAAQSITEFRQSGTVFKGDLTKTVRYFETVNDVRVAKYKQVIRTSKSVVGAGKNSKLVRSIDQTTGLIQITEVANKTKLEKLVGYKNTALAAIEGIGAAKAEKIGQAGKYLSTGAEYLIRKKENEERVARGEAPLDKTRASTARPISFKIQDILKPAQRAVKGLVDAAREGTPAADHFITQPRELPQKFDDRNAKVTYVDLHSRQPNWLALNWTSVAANTTTTVFSPFDVDQSSDVGIVLSSHKMVAGQVSEFSQAAVVAYAERSVGGVGGEVGRHPAQVS